ncbi:MAG: hypothetical protein KIT44_02735 [Opitutaceae bacterium]|nr:hypothetical protein [Opitutaceae bacterium]
MIKTLVGVSVTTVIGRALTPKLRPGSLHVAGNSPLQMSRDPITPHRIIYGETRVAGPIAYAQEAGTNNQYLHLVIPMAAHECEAIGQVWFNHEVVPLDGVNATGTYAGLARIKKHLGAADQAADSDLVTESGGTWTSDHRLRGIAYLYPRLTWSQDKFPGGLPNISALVKGRKVYDPRTSTTAWSDNPALCIRDYLLNPAFGMAVDSAEIDEASFIAAANICDEEVDLAAGGTEKRYTVNGSFDLLAEPATVIEQLAAAMAGVVVYAGGKWYCHAGAHRTPTVTLTEADLRAPATLQTKQSMRDTCNRVKGIFISPAQQWQPDDFVPVEDSTALTEDGVEIWRDLELPFTTSHSMAQRLAKIELRRTRHDITLAWPGKLNCLLVQPGDVVMVTYPRFGFSSKTFVVVDSKFDAQDGADRLGLGVDLELRETDSSIYGWSTADEGAHVPPAQSELYNPLVVPMPGGITLGTEYFAQPDGTLVPRLKVEWSAANNVFVLSGGKVHIEYKKTADSDWLVWTSSLRGNATLDYITDVLAGVSYDVRLAFENSQGVKGAYSDTEDHTVSTDAVATAAPGSLSATAAPASVNLAWAEVADTRLAYYRVYRRPSAEANDIAGATLVWAGRATSWTDFLVTQGVTYRYWVRAISHTGVASAASDPATAAPNPSTGNFIDYRFKRATTAPDTPTGDNPSGWSDSPPTTPADQPLWMSKAEKTSTGTLVGAWSAPIQLTGEDGQDGEAGADGEDGDSLEVQYSVNGSSDWHFPFADGDLYMRQRVGAGDWSIAIRIVGEAGAPGGTFSITLHLHPSGGGEIDGTPGGPGTHVKSGLAAGGVYEIRADATVGGETFQYWQSAWPDGELVQVETSNITNVLLTKNLVLTAYYL